MTEKEQPPFLHSAPPLVTYVEKAASQLRLPAILVVAFLCLLIYAAGYLVAAGVGETTQFLAYFVIPTGIIGFGFVLAVLVWAHRRYAIILWDLRHAFKHSYQDQLRAHWRRLTNPLRALWVEAPLTSAAAGYVLLVRFDRTTWDAIPEFSHWIAYGSPPLFAYLTICAGLAGFIGSMGAYLILEHISFLRTLSTTPSNDHALLAREVDLGQLARFSFYVSGTWFVGLAFVTIVFYHDFTPYTVAAYVLAMVLGMVFFVVPQVIIHQNIVGAKNALKNRIRENLPKEWTGSDDLKFAPDTVAMLSLIHEVDKLEEWPVEVNVIMLELIAALTPILTAVTAGQLGVPI